MDREKIMLRLGKPNDLDHIQRLFMETVRTVCRADYSPEQIEAWISRAKDRDRWLYKMKEHYFLIAEFEKALVGFASLEGNNHLDLLYVHRYFQKQGIAGSLYEKIEEEGITLGATILYANVSITARRFFERKGFLVKTAQINDICNIQILNFKMIKELCP